MSKTILNSDLIVSGNITFKDTLELHGKYTGKIDSKGLLFIARTASVKAKVNVDSVTVEGEFHGDINALSLITLKATAKVFGNMIAKNIIVQEGAVLVGNCEIRNNIQK